MKPTLTATVAAVSSRRGIVNVFNGATLDFAMTRVVEMWPLSSSNRKLLASPYPTSLASEK